MSTEASELHRIISASVRDMLDPYRLGVGGAGDRQGALMNTSLEGGTMATYHVVAIIETPDENEEENEIEQAMLDR